MINATQRYAKGFLTFDPSKRLANCQYKESIYGYTLEGGKLKLFHSVDRIKVTAGTVQYPLLKSGAFERDAVSTGLIANQENFTDLETEAYIMDQGKSVFCFPAFISVQFTLDSSARGRVLYSRRTAYAK